MAKRDTSYQGHKNRHYWNVCLYIFNEYRLYTLARECVQTSRNLTEATQRFLDAMGPNAHTPDGYPYTKATVRAALKDINEP